MATFSTSKDLNGSETIVRVNDDGSVDSIPTDDANTDYQAYLATLPEKPKSDSTN